MANVLVDETALQDIADAIRTKNGQQTTYKPGQMADAIEAIPSGGITPTGTVNINSNGTHDVTQYASANVNVPNSYAASDEGKVVSNGALVAQGSDTVTQNGTVDTTLINSLTVNVPSTTPSGTKQISITQNGTTTEDVTNYANAEITVNVPSGIEKTTGTIQISATKYDNIFIPFLNADTKLHCLKIYSGGFNVGDDISGAPYGTYKRFFLMLDIERNMEFQCIINYAGTGYTYDGNMINFGSSTSSNYVALTSSGITLNKIRFGGASREWLQTDEDYTWEAW